METISLQPMADQEIDQVSGGVLPVLAVAAFKIGGKILGSAAFTIATTYAYHGIRAYFHKT